MRGDDPTNSSRYAQSTIKRKGLFSMLLGMAHRYVACGAVLHLAEMHDLILQPS